MTAPQMHRVSLLLALAGILMMLTVAIGRLQLAGEVELPNRESSAQPGKVHRVFMPRG